MPKLAFNLTADTVALVDSDQSRLWVVYTLEQYAAIDADHGTFSYEELRLPSQGLRPQAPVVAHLTGLPADMLVDALLEVVGQLDPQFQSRLATGINSVNWRWQENVSTVVYGNSPSRCWLAIVHSFPQLQEVQRRFFPTEPARVAAFQSVARLPLAADEQPFVVVGAVAAVCLQGCAMRGSLV